MAHAGGRPLKFKTVKELQDKIDDYFKVCDETKEPYMITGLALHLDTDRQTLINYTNREEYFDTIKKAKLKVEKAYEKRLIKQGRGGDIFALKNFGWTDRQELVQDIKVTNVADKDQQKKIAEEILYDNRGTNTTTSDTEE